MSKKKDIRNFKKEEPEVFQPRAFQPQRTHWEAQVEELTECGKVKAPVVVLSQKALGQIIFLMQKFQNTEWAADLIGTIEGNIYKVAELYIFEQEVTATHVKRLEAPPAGTIGVLHSHHGMGTFFSGTDDDFANSNHQISGVVAVARQQPALLGEYDVQFTGKVKTPCGCWKRFERLQVKIEYPVVQVSGVEKIKERVIQYYPPWFQQQGGYNGYSDWL